MSLKGKTSRKWANGRNIYDSENKIDPRESSIPVLGLNTCMTIIVKFIGIYLRSQVSIYRTIGPLVNLSKNGTYFCSDQFYFKK